MTTQSVIKGARSAPETTANGAQPRPHAASAANPAPRRKGLYANCLRTYLKAVAQLPEARILDRVLLRTASRRGVDLMALSETDARLRYKDLLEHVNVPGSDWQTLWALSAGALKPSALARIARVIALQDIEAEDRANALNILRWLFAQCGDDVFDRDERRLFQNLAFSQGDFALAAKLVETLSLSRIDALVMRADLANPWGPSPYADQAKWQSSFSRLFELYSVEAPSIAIQCSATGEPFDGLQCPIAGAIADGPLVSVIMTCWQPGPELETSLRSILNQTWRNLEVLLVDDASPLAYQETLLRAQEMDPRIRLLRQDENGGTYVARSAALAVASGEFVTGQDSDDWSHPRRIEGHVREMLSKQNLISTTSHALRCDPAMLFVAPGMLARRENASSLMFRRVPAIEQVGYYDATRKGGDTEYMLRLHRVFGQHSHRLLEANLALIRRSRDSLSHAEFRPGWRHPARTAYRRGYEFWHQIESRSDALRLDVRVEGPRPFPLPQRFAVRRAPSQRSKKYDAVFVDDLRPSTGVRHLRALFDEIRCLLATGQRVGITHLRSFRDIGFEPIDTYWRPIAHAIQDGFVDEVLLTDALEVGAVVIRRPEVALFSSLAGTALRPGKVVVVAEEAVRQPDGCVWYDPVACHRNLRDAFAAPIEWAAAPPVKQELTAILPVPSNVGRPYPVVVDARNWRYPARAAGRKQLILGCVADQGMTGVEDGIARLLAAFTEDAGVEVRLLCDEAVASALPKGKHLPENWLCMHSEVDMEAFLGGCDFLVGLDVDTDRPAQQRLFSQAMASGCVVIATQEYAGAHQGVLGCDIGDLQTRVVNLWRDVVKYREQVELAFNFVREHDGGWMRKAQLASRLGLVERRRNEHASRGDRGPIEPRMADVPSVPRVVRQHAALYESRGFLREIDRTILRTGSPEGRDIIACIASRGRLTWNQLRSLLSEYRAGRQIMRTRRVFEELDPTIARRLARVVALQALRPDDRISALTLFKALIDVHGLRALDWQHGKLALDLAFYLRDWAFLECYRNDLLPAHAPARRFVELDLCNPFIGSPFADQARWLELFNQHYLDAAIAPVQLEDPDEKRRSPFDRLSSGPLAPVEGALVTVVTSSWHPDESLVHAVRSITRQTWRNLEILLIDDASPEEFTPLLESVAASDPRIRLIRQPHNGGTYIARNRGMAEAKGRYFTVHDSDDWAHPQRIEMQIRALQSDERLVSTGSFAFRCNDDLVMNFPGALPDRENASSLTFELDKVRQRIGYFDESRKGADTEYVLRMRAAFGEDSHQILREPLALIRLRPDSLSRAEFKPGWRHPARALYRRNYEAWHRRIGHDPSAAYVHSPLSVRPFPLPTRFKVAQRPLGEEEEPGYDILFAADFRASASPDRSICHEILAAKKAGLKVAVLHMESFWHASLREIEPYDPDLEQLLHDKQIDEVLYTDGDRIELLVVRDPSILQFPQPHTSALQIGEIIIVGGLADDGTDPAFDVGDCANFAYRMFGIEPRWCAQGEKAATRFAEVVSTRMLDPRRWPESVVESASYPSVHSDRDLESRSNQEILGSIGRIVPSGPVDAIAAWWADFGDLSKGTLMRLLGSTNPEHAVDRRGNVVIEAHWISRLAFLRRCDFYTDHPAQTRDPAQYRWILEAMAQGCIPVLSLEWELVFGTAAKYCSPEALPDHVSVLAQDPEELARARARAVTWAGDRNGAASLQPFWALARRDYI